MARAWTRAPVWGRTDPNIRKKFNTYRFADHQEKVIDLLKRVCTGSVTTVEVIGSMQRVQE
ncbi:MAG: hypothetical protein KDC02_19010 [Flavobacteriales bacterium]|nr:hypothetical protein [Flavobacteriales bacterium]